MAAQGKPGDRISHERALGPVLLAVAGGSGSGKTTFSRLLCEALGPAVAALLPQDAYYRDRHDAFDRDGGALNFDHPDALEFSLLAEHLKVLKSGHAIDVPIYDFVTHSRRQASVRLEACPVIVVDGILLLSQAELRPNFDQTFFVDTPEDSRFRRRLARDTTERGRTPEGVREQFFKQVKPMHDLFVAPSKSFADVILDGTRPFTETIAFLKDRLLNSGGR